MVLKALKECIYQGIKSDAEFTICFAVLCSVCVLCVCAGEDLGFPRGAKHVVYSGAMK